MAQDSKLRQYLFATAVSVLLGLAGCVGTSLFGRVSALENENTNRKVDNAVIRQEVEDFRKSFEDFKKDVKDDIAKHHAGPNR